MTKHAAGLVLIVTVVLGYTSSAAAQGTSTGSSGGGSSGGGTSSGGMSGGLSGGTSSGGGLSSGGFGGGGDGSSFLGTGAGIAGTGGFLTGGSAPGNLGQAARAGGQTSTNNGDLFARYYVNPLALGLSSSSSSSSATIPQFGTPLYASLYPGTTITSPFATSNISGALGTNRLSTSGLGVAVFVPAGTIITRPIAAYTTNIGFKYRPTPPSQRVTEMQQMLARSSDLTAANQIQVVLVDGIVVLKGTVPDPDQRRIAENLVRLSPGIRAVRNELAVAGGPPQARP